LERKPEYHNIEGTGFLTVKAEEKFTSVFPQNKFIATSAY
jgi:hypothetical protein